MLDRIARFAFDNCGSVVSAQRIAEYMKSQRIRISVDTVLNYLGYLESAYLLRRAARDPTFWRAARHPDWVPKRRWRTQPRRRDGGLPIPFMGAAIRC